ncbi:hypothetical protein GE09DRAFT_1118507 [Coniochaeta sp. 2T2.1]|nr:hypothetical protein GE09DRAFT_1118507 [Coniochaeta sp. 2T2.1]
MELIRVFSRRALITATLSNFAVNPSSACNPRSYLHHQRQHLAVDFDLIGQRHLDYDNPVSSYPTSWLGSAEKGPG